MTTKTKTITNKIIGIVLCLTVAVLTVSAVAPVSAAATGKMANIVVFVRHNGDTEDVFNSGTNSEKIFAMFNDTSEQHTGLGISVDYSFKNYINTVSRGQLQIENYFPQSTGSAINVLTLQNSRDYYTDDVYIIGEIMDAFDNGTLTLPAGKLDNAQSQVLDCLMIITQGTSDDFPDDEVLYPHKGVYGSAELLCNSLYVRNYVMIDSHSLLNGQKQGVVTHEFMHVIGYPDLYRNSGNGMPVGYWDIMAAVSPYMQYPLAYMRSLYGWVPVSEITQSGTYTLNAASASSGTAAFKIQTPMSDSEFFMLEYRVKNTDTVAGLGIETKIPTSGLLAYRINNAVEERSNFIGNDYVYVFRPNDTSTTASAGDIYYAAVNPSEGETSYGSADFDAPLTDNTIFYSSGQNSGIVIENAVLSQDGSSITFDISFPDYSSLDIWDKTGDAFGSSIVGDVKMDVSHDGNIFVAATKSGDWSYSGQSFKWDGSSWTKMGGDIADAFDQRVTVLDGTVYMAYCNANGNPVVRRGSGTSWTTVATITNASYPSSMNLVNDGTQVYLSFAKDGNTLEIYRVTQSGIELIDDTLTSSDSFASVAVMPYDGQLYAIYSYFGWNLTEKRTLISSYDPDTGFWSDEYTLAIEGTNTHRAVVREGKLYFLTGVTGKTPVLAVYDGIMWTSESVTLSTTSYTGLAVDVAGGIVYVTYLTGTDVVLIKKTDDNWETLSTVTRDCAGFDFVMLNGTAYIAAVSQANGNVSVYTRQLYTPVVATTITVTAAQTRIQVGTAMALSAVFSPANKVSAVTWSSSNVALASVSSNGLMTAIKEGNVLITATDEHGNTGSLAVQIYSAAARLKIFCYDGDFTQQVSWWTDYSAAQMQLGFLQYNCDDAVRFEWNSNSARVNIDQNGNITNIGDGQRSSEITLTAYDAQGDVVASDSVTVSFYKFNWVQRLIEMIFGWLFN